MAVMGPRTITQNTDRIWWEDFLESLWPLRKSIVNRWRIACSYRKNELTARGANKHTVIRGVFESRERDVTRRYETTN
jgi:hypothetical protein